MKNEPRYSDDLTMKEFRIAACDEIEIEAIVWKYRQSNDKWAGRYHDADRAALIEIERLKLSGEYESERGRLAARLNPPSAVEQRIAQRIEASDLEPISNFLDGLDSTDREQRVNFERLYNELADKAPREIWHILLCLEKAKKPKGRPGASPPWRNVVTALDGMRLAVAKGATIPQAARDAAAIEGRATQDNRAKYFERRYRQRAALRE